MNQQQTSQVWSLLGQTWGAKFLDQYGANPNDAWTAALSHVRPEAARHAIHRLIKDGSAFAPTLPEFIAAADDYRPESSTSALPGPTTREPTTAELRMAATFASEFNEYRDYERWRDTNTKQGKRPPHPTPHSPDWEYLHRLALIQASKQNAAAGREQHR